jgi:hypothetical protein
MAFEGLKTRVTAVKASGKAPLIVNVHIPKTAGSTLRHQIVKHLEIYRVDPVAQFDDYYKDLARRLAGVVPTMAGRKETLFASGHYRYRDATSVLGPIKEQTFMVAFIRDPVKRFLSDYFYSISETNLTHKAMRQQFPTVEHYIRAPGQSGKQLEYLRPWEGASLHETFDVLCAECALVGVAEDYEAHADYLFDAFDLPKRPRNEKRNVGTDQEGMAAAYAKFHDVVAEAHRYEIELYNLLRGATAWIGK